MLLLKKSIVAAILFMGIILAFFIFIEFSSDVTLAQSGEFPDACGSNREFTQDFLTDFISETQFSPYQILNRTLT